VALVHDTYIATEISMVKQHSSHNLYTHSPTGRKISTWWQLGTTPGHHPQPCRGHWRVAVPAATSECSTC